MLDGAGASTALDVIDERNKEQLLNKNQKISKLSENKIEDNSQKHLATKSTRLNLKKHLYLTS